jgi:hypothetical protein
MEHMSRSVSAGISLDTGTRVTETDVELFRRTFETNVFGLRHAPQLSNRALVAAPRAYDEMAAVECEID